MGDIKCGEVDNFVMEAVAGVSCRNVEPSPMLELVTATLPLNALILLTFLYVVSGRRTAAAAAAAAAGVPPAMVLEGKTGASFVLIIITPCPEELVDIVVVVVVVVIVVVVTKCCLIFRNYLFCFYLNFRICFYIVMPRHAKKQREIERECPILFSHTHFKLTVIYLFHSISGRISFFFFCSIFTRDEPRDVKFLAH